MKKKRVLLALLPFLFLAKVYCQDDIYCGTWRTSVKDLTDSKGIEIFQMTPDDATIAALIAEKAPKKLATQSKEDGELPRYNSESKTVKIFAYVYAINKKEGDHDYHLMLSSEADETGDKMDAEIPDPDCSLFSSFDDLKVTFKKYRVVAEDIYKLLKQGKKYVHVEIHGVPFWDGVHNQTGGAPNGREIHPITFLKIID